jgi:GNAT superfamily N-acetyltransferase
MLTFRQLDDAAAVVPQVLGPSLNRDVISEERFLRHVVLDPNFRKEGSIFAFDGEKPVGYCLTVARQVPVEGEIADPDRGYLWLMGVLPDYQNRGIGTELLKQAEAYLQSQDRKICMASCYSPGYFWPGVDVDAYGTALEFLLKRGYEEVYRPISCQTKLADLEMPGWVADLHSKAEAAGIVFSQNPRHHLPAILKFAKEEFGPDWARFFRDSALRVLDGDKRTEFFVAHSGDKVLGLAHFDGERFGPIGVSASVRGRGLGQILMWKVLEQQRAAGFKVSWFLWSDDKTLDRLYRHAGFEIDRRFALLRKLL